LFTHLGTYPGCTKRAIRTSNIIKVPVK